MNTDKCIILHITNILHINSINEIIFYFHKI